MVALADRAACRGVALPLVRLRTLSDSLLVVELDRLAAGAGGIDMLGAPYLTIDIRCTLLLSMLA